MDVMVVEKDEFTVIGRLGSTRDGEDFIARLWHDADSGFYEIADLVKTTPQGTLVGLWGAMSDFSMSFQPWEDFRHGLYLAGAEAKAGVDEAPAGWTLWHVPGFRFLQMEKDAQHGLPQALQYMREHGYALCGAVQDHADPATGKDYIMVPIARL